MGGKAQKSGQNAAIEQSPDQITPQHTAKFPPRLTRLGKSAWQQTSSFFSRPIFKEPLLHFIVAGLAIFAISEVVEHHFSRYRIHYGPQQESRLISTFQQQYGVAPSETELARLRQGFVREEVLYREALAIGLDEGDEIVRRRLIQKFEYLNEDVDTVRPPSAHQLRAYFNAHRAQYDVAEKRLFQHVYFATDGVGDSTAAAKARAALGRLNSGENVAGDIFPGPSSFPPLDAAAIVRIFGGNDFAQQIGHARQNVWAGPFRSAYGWHLVRVQQIIPAQTGNFDDVRDTVKEDWLASERRSRSEARFEDARRNYYVDGLTADQLAQAAAAPHSASGQDAPAPQANSNGGIASGIIGFVPKQDDANEDGNQREFRGHAATQNGGAQ